jgi:hypothetical protein
MTDDNASSHSLVYVRGPTTALGLIKTQSSHLDYATYSSTNEMTFFSLD